MTKISLENNILGFTDLDFFSKLSIFQQREILDQLPADGGLPVLFFTRDELDAHVIYLADDNFVKRQELELRVKKRIAKLREIHRKTRRIANVAIDKPLEF